MNNLKITFGIIVLNGEPFIEYNLRSLYPFAHQIIVVEGASPAAKNIASLDGHSVDGTLEKLKAFKRNNDPENKVIIVTAEDEGYPNGFWPGEKLEQSQAYAKRATGDYLWQVDIDEFYKTEDMRFVVDMLVADPSITAVSFQQRTFWGGLDYIVDGWYLRWRANEVHRLFRWGPGYEYVNHRPPTVIDKDRQNLREQRWIRGKDLSDRDLFFYHYSLLFPKQVQEKVDYYANASWNKVTTRMDDWARNNYFQIKNPFRVHNVYTYISWLERYTGDHPPEVVEMMRHMKGSELRETEDIEILLNKPFYKLIRQVLVLLDKPVFFLNQLIWLIRNLKKVILGRAKWKNIP